MHHLTCFLPGMLFLGYHELEPDDRQDNWLRVAEELLETCFAMYGLSSTRLGAEVAQFSEDGTEMRIAVKDQDAANNRLRPETVESLFYAWWFTGENR